MTTLKQRAAAPTPFSEVKTNLAISVLVAEIVAVSATEREAHALCQRLVAELEHEIDEEFAAISRAGGIERVAPNRNEP